MEFEENEWNARNQRKYSIGFALIEAGLAAITSCIPHPHNLSETGDVAYRSLIYAGAGIFSLLCLESIYGAFKGKAHPILREISCRQDFKEKIGSDLKKILSYNP
jgi:hypothetical protein